MIIFFTKLINKLKKYIKKHEKTIGFIAATLGVIMFISLIEILISNMKGDSKIFIQPLATAINGFFWSLYALSIKDRFVLIPNLLALTLGLITAISAFIWLKIKNISRVLNQREIFKYCSYFLVVYRY